MTFKTILYILILISFTGEVSSQVCVGDQGQIQWEYYNIRPFNSWAEDDFGEFLASPNYPNHPEVVKTLYRTEAPNNYNDYYGSRIRGFIMADSFANVDLTFNVTGDDRVQFFLSSDENPTNMALVAYTLENTGYEDHNEFPSQTSATISMTAGQHYYFELLSMESRGSDHMRLWWKNPVVNATTWNLISSKYLFDVGCLPPKCPALNTPCDDGNASTQNDVEDGNCHCIGEPISQSNACIGDREVIKKYRYDNITGGTLDDLFGAANFPGMPDFSQNFSVLGQPDTDDEDNSGSLIQGYLTVPVTGLYKFNFTSDDQGIAFLSSDEDPANKQSHQFLVSGYTEVNEHDKYIYQNTSFINLIAGQYYYFEINHKNGGGGCHFNTFWQTPYTEVGVWKHIPSIYFYSYDCEIACIAENTPCDDGNPMTNNDQYDNSCNCVGTPCTAPDCDEPLGNFVPLEKCAVTEQLDDNALDNWLSCTGTTHTTAGRSGHWIQYDFDQSHQFLNSRVWNYNGSGNEDLGFQNVAVDYSEDGVNWTELGTYNWALSGGGSSYAGFNGPNFNGVMAKHILITSLDGPSSCRGIGKVAFSAVLCPQAGTLCNDLDANTVNDKYDNSCNCTGVSMLENLCENQNLVLGDSVLLTNNFSAIEELTSISQINSQSTVSFYGGGSVELLPGFETQPSTVFWASIDDCESALELQHRNEVVARAVKDSLAKEEIQTLTVSPVEGTDEVVIQFYLKQPGRVILDIEDQNGRRVTRLLDYEYKNTGVYTKRIRSKKLTQGIFKVSLTSAAAQEYKSLVVEG